MRQGHYFGAGPAPLPTPVVETAAQQLIEYGGLGIGLGEVSHRSKQATQIIDDAKAKVVKLLDVPDTHEVLFVQGGGTGGFATVVYALLGAYAKRTGRKGRADYLVTGSWSAKAAAEARRLGVETNIVADGKEASGKYTQIPDRATWKFGPAEETAYVYYCDNETVDGIEFSKAPTVPEGVDLVVDISSNMFSREIDVARHALIFGGAQKNVGIAGVSLYIVAKRLLEQAPAAELLRLGVPVAPSLLDLTLVAKNNSAYNTVSIFAVQVVNLVLARLIEAGGLAAQAEESNAKAKKLYAAIDARPDVFVTAVREQDRSRMNIVFTLRSAESEARFLEGAAERKLTGLKGHRSVGGIRVSNYNAVSPQAVDELVEFISGFQ